MLASEGWATMYGGGFSEIVLYSRVSYIVSRCIIEKELEMSYSFVGCSACHVEQMAKAELIRRCLLL